eukprot:jgi/Chlat1/3395/Chrsp23S03812
MADPPLTPNGSGGPAPHGPPLGAENLRYLFDQQRKYMDHFFSQLETGGSVRKFAELLHQCQGTVFFTGVGKSGFIAQKISQTLVSTGTRAVFLSPVDALHGDIGIVSAADVVVMFSKSGSTDELLRLIPACKAKGAFIVGITSCPGSRLDRSSNFHVHLPLDRELCPYDLAPVTSTAIQMLFGDTVAIALMQANHLTKEQYALNHPAGRIGKRLILKGCGCIIITDEDKKLLGTFTDGDLRRALNKNGAAVLDMKLEELMTRKPRTIEASAMAVEAMKAMENPTCVTFLPVIDDAGGVAGLITLHGLINAGL